MSQSSQSCHLNAHFMGAAMTSMELWSKYVFCLSFLSKKKSRRLVSSSFSLSSFPSFLLFCPSFSFPFLLSSLTLPFFFFFFWNNFWRYRMLANTIQRTFCIYFAEILLLLRTLILQSNWLMYSLLSKKPQILFGIHQFFY